MRPAQEIIADLATAGLSAEQLALVMELSVAVAAEARPVMDKAAQNKREYDRQYQADRRKSRTKSYDKDDGTTPPKENISNPPVPISNEIGVDPEKVMFDSGVEILTSTGATPTKARTLLGKWKRDYGAPDVISALSAAKREGAIEPVAFIEAALRTRARQQAPPEGAWAGP